MVEPSTTIPIIPMKPLNEGKSRLGRQFSEAQRADLSAGMLRRVILAIRGASIGLFWVVGGDERVLRLVHDLDGVWIEEM